ncbi:MAG: hypothetical protein FWG63_01045 [Defluviitaleaceae bacterium]|nr:hypothetical protein [Defluviitaleaceae bacterium]
MTNATVRDFRCNGCGSPLKIPKNSRGHVTCPSCKTDSVIDGLVKNAEMAEKENIASGIPLTASSAILHRKLVSYIAETPGMPLDVFEKGVVVSEEHHCVPAFYFYTNGTASYTYEAGNVRQQKIVRENTEKSWVETHKHMEWTQMTGSANASAEVVASGNKKFSSQVKDLYMLLDGNKLHDFDELEFTHDVITHDYNYPQTASFNEHAKPYIEQLLRNNAKKQLSGKDFRALNLGGSRIDKDEVVRIFLGMYRIVFEYNGKEYVIWATGDGEKATSEVMPVDSTREAAINSKKQDMEKAVSDVPVPTTGKFRAGFWGSLVLGIFLAPVFDVIAFVLGIVGAVVFSVLKSNVMAPYEAKCSEIRSKFQSEIDSLEAEARNVVQQFKSKKQPLRGIYEQEVSGDASAF